MSQMTRRFICHIKAHFTNETQTTTTTMQNTFNTERYVIQKDLWPQSGRHILAQYTDDAILVYQAYNNQIADYALQHQKLGGPHWSSTRMSWIKTNFLWMMFRSNWGTKKNQDRILGIWLKRSSFEKYIAMVYSKDICSERGTVRIQWYCCFIFRSDLYLILLLL